MYMYSMHPLHSSFPLNIFKNEETVESSQVQNQAMLCWSKLNKVFIYLFPSLQPQYSSKYAGWEVHLSP